MFYGLPSCVCKETAGFDLKSFESDAAGTNLSLFALKIVVSEIGSTSLPFFPRKNGHQLKCKSR